MKNKRPVNLNLTSFKYPATAIASILHRITGVVLFLSIPILLYLLCRSLASAASFSATHLLLQGFWWKLIVWGVLTAVYYHLFAGIRHIFMDLGWGEGLGLANGTAIVVIVLVIILSILTGFWLW